MSYHLIHFRSCNAVANNPRVWPKWLCQCAWRTRCNDFICLLYNQHICMNQLSQTYYSSKHVIYWFAAIMIKCLGQNAHLEPLVLAHIYFLKNTTAPVLRLLSHSLSVWAIIKLLTLNETPYYQALINFDQGGAQWLSVWLETEGPPVWASPASLPCVLEQDTLINPSLVMVQPRKTNPYITERLLMGRKESNQTNKTWIMDPKL